jgi:hypothetical protein
MNNENQVLIKGDDMIFVKKDQLLYNVEFQSDEDGVMELKINEYKFVDFLTKDVHIEGIDISENSIPATLIDTKFPKIEIKTDIEFGYFFTAEKATRAFIEMMTEITKRSIDAYEKQFGKYS